MEEWRLFGTTNLAVAVDEFGLIRGVQAIVDRSHDLPRFLRHICHEIQPLYFLSDYDKTYPKIVQDIHRQIIFCKDFVHAIGNIYREAQKAINGVSVTTRGTMTKKRKAGITKLQKRLLRKRVYPVLHKIRKGFWANNASIGTLYIEGGLAE